MLALDLLQDTAASHVGVAVAGEHQHRNAVHIAGGHADDGIHRPRADGGKDGQRHPCEAVVAIGQVYGGLLVPYLEVPELVLSKEGIRQPQRTMTRDASDVGHAFVYQGLYDHLSASQFHRHGSLSNRRTETDALILPPPSLPAPSAPGHGSPG